MKCRRIANAQRDAQELPCRYAGILLTPTVLAQALGTPAKIFYKYEGVSPTGSHKPNTAVPQVQWSGVAVAAR
jgi:predicted alternative tryptophan synthase beta-subunit